MVMELDIKNLLPKKELNADFWKGENNILDEEIKKQLVKMVLFFKEQLAIELDDIEDIIITGSIANYNWSKYSDVDLHVLVDFDKINVDRDLLEDYFNSKKNLWNNLHDIKTHGHDVEIYVQDSKEQHVATGLYSLVQDKWLAVPTPEFKDFNKELVKQKTRNYMKLIDFIEEKLKTEPLQAMKMSDKLQDKLKAMRQAGLERDGEFSPENLTYKLLRRQKHLERLYSVENDAFDKLMTL
jgi:predicted nucleotidyltransferase